MSDDRADFFLFLSDVVLISLAQEFSFIRVQGRAQGLRDVRRETRLIAASTA